MTGIGIDIVSIPRIEKMLNKFNKKALKKFLNENEIKLINSPLTAAGFWAAKEAFSKALGTGIRKGVNFKDIEDAHDFAILLESTSEKIFVQPSKLFH